MTKNNKQNLLIAITAITLAGCNSDSSNESERTSTANPEIEIVSGENSASQFIGEWGVGSLRMELPDGFSVSESERVESDDGVSIELRNYEESNQDDDDFDETEQKELLVTINETPQNSSNQMVIGGTSERILDFSDQSERPFEDEDQYFEDSDFESMDITTSQEDGFVDIPITVKDSGHDLWVGQTTVSAEVMATSRFVDGDDLKIKTTGSSGSVDYLYEKDEAPDSIAVAQSVIDHPMNILDLKEDRDIYQFFVDYVYAMGIISYEEKENLRSDFNPKRDTSSYSNLNQVISNTENSIGSYFSGEITNEEISDYIENNLFQAISSHERYAQNKYDQIEPFYSQIVQSIDFSSQPYEFSESTGTFSRFIGNEQFGSLNEETGEFQVSREFEFMKNLFQETPNTPATCYIK